MKEKGFASILIVITLLAILIGLYYFGSKPVTLSPPATSPTPDPTLNWNTYTSPTFNYLFKYPNTWNISTFNEADPKILFGSNSLQSFSSTGIENYMDHGIIDWKSFLADKPGIKIDFAVYSKSPGTNQFQDSKEFLNNFIGKTAIKMENSDLVIGNLPTEQYKNTEDLGPTDVPELNTFVAYPNDNQLIYMNLLFWNIESYELLKQTPEWQEFTQIVSTFEFTNSN